MQYHDDQNGHDGAARVPGMSPMERPRSQGPAPGSDSRSSSRRMHHAHRKGLMSFDAENTLLEKLDQDSSRYLGTSPQQDFSQKSEPARGLHRRRASKLQQFVKQVSSRRLGSFSNQQYYGSNDDGEDSPDTNDRGLINNRPTSSRRLFESENTDNSNGRISNSSQRNLTNIQRASHSRTSSGGSSRRSSFRRRPSIQQKTLEMPLLSDYVSNIASTLEETEDSTSEESVKDDVAPDGSGQSPPRLGLHRRQRTTTDTLYDHALQLDHVFNTGPVIGGGFLTDIFEANQEEEEVEDAYSDISDDEDNNERDLEGGPDDGSPLLPQRRQQGQRRIKFMKKLKALIAFMRPQKICKDIRDFFLYNFLMMQTPLLALSAILFYYFDNPNFNFLPTDASLAWWLLFLVRLMLTLSLTRATKYFVRLLTQTYFFVRAAGPFVALVALQSKGWPFRITFWAMWNFLLLHGSEPFFRHWLYFTDIALFSTEANPGFGILNSNFYSRVLGAMAFVGIAAAAKRTVVALYLSQRMLQYYRSQLHDVLNDMRLVMELANLAAETETEEFEKLMEQEKHSQRNVSGDFALKVNRNMSVTMPKIAVATQPPEIKATTDPGQDDDDDEEDDVEVDDDDGEGDENQSGSATGTENDSFGPLSLGPLGDQSNKSRSGLSVDGTEASRSLAWNDLKSQARKKNDRKSATTLNRSNSSLPASQRRRGVSKLESRLLAWKEPETKGTKKSEPSIDEILNFRRAMDCMDNPFPFSAAFGPARNRRECIKSAARVYKRLLRFTPGETVLPYDVIGTMAYGEDEQLDEKRAKELLEAFTPDKDDCLTLVSFVQSVDYIYKHLRFLRAAILNSSKIDSVLEDVFNVLFYGIMAIFVMSLLGLNPWPLLVSFSTLMVSFAFSFGPSAAKYIEGMLMIAVRRPYDIGDRITIVSGESIQNPTVNDSYIVEDITLSTTTLRFAATNEVSTVNNAAIANSRIVNAARSENAIVTVFIRLAIEATQETIENFRIRVENYILDRPEWWVEVVHFRNEGVDHNASSVTYSLRVKHQQAWQEQAPILLNKGQLEQQMEDVANDLGIAWLSSHHRIRIMEVPTIRQESLGSSDAKGILPEPQEEPFVKFLKHETGPSR